MRGEMERSAGPREFLPRVIPLEGAANLRDLGGYVGAEGRRVRFGRLYRSASPAALSAADHARIQALGIRTICDFRGRRERERALYDEALAAKIHAIPIEPKVGGSVREIMATREATGEDVFELLRRAYRAYVTDCAPVYARFLSVLLDPEAPPVLFHCTAGKDRTGFAAALVLGLLGVDFTEIRADYLASNRLWAPDAAMRAAVPGAAGEVLFAVHAELLEEAFGLIGERWGSLEAYAEAMLGVDGAALDRLRRLYLEA